MQIYPVEFFEGREFTVDPALCFVMMPFTEPWSNRTFAVIRDTVSTLGYEATRADDVYGRVVLSDIWSLINRAAFVIADLTGANPNVYYELGIAHTVGKDIIPLLQNGTAVPFDQQPFRILFYEDNRDGEAVLRQRLPTWIESLDYSASPQMLLRRQRVAVFNSWKGEHEAPNLTRTNFDGLELQQVDLRYSFLSESSFVGSDLSGARLMDAILIRAVLHRAKLTGADLTRANLSEVRAEGAQFSDTNLEEAVLIRARLDGADFSNANLTNATIDAFTLQKYRGQLARGANFERMIVESG